MEFSKESLDQIYAYYFGSPKNIDAVYHRVFGIEPQVFSTCAPDEKDIPAGDESWKISKMVRGALGMNKDGNIAKIFSSQQLNDVRSLLANLVKIKDEQTKKRVLLYFRLLARYYLAGKQRFDNISMQEELRKLVARVAVVNGIATYEDYYILLRHNLVADTKKVMNDLIEQSKKDIKSELALDVPMYCQIENICDDVKNCVKYVQLPENTIERFNKEFDPDAIIANGEYIEKFVESIELKRAKVDAEEYKLGMYPKLIDEITKLRAEKENLTKATAEMSADLNVLNSEVKTVHASLLSRGVNRYKDTVLAITEKYKQVKTQKVK